MSKKRKIFTLIVRNKKTELSRHCLLSKDITGLRFIGRMLRASFLTLLLSHGSLAFAEGSRAVNDPAKMPSHQIDDISTLQFFDDYDAYKPKIPIAWRSANESVEAIGGWKAYARDIYRHKKSKQVRPEE